MNAIAKTPLRQVQNVKHLLMNDAAKEQLQMVAAKHLNPERMMRVVANAIRTTPKLQQCEPISFLGALMQCASLGLEPNTILGHAYLIPFDNKKKGVTEVQVVIGYKGLIDLARRSGHITSISANIHYSDDELWTYEEGTEATLRHRPGPQEGKKLHAYAIAQFKDGGHAYVVLPWKKVMAIRDASQNWQTAVRYGKTATAIWTIHEDAMAMKTAVRALAKYLPLSVEFSDALTIDEAKGADYRGFAMDPTNGVQIDGEEIEGEAVEAEQIEEEKPADPPKQTEQPKSNPAADAALEAEARRVAAKREAEAKAKAEAEAKAAKAKADAAKAAQEAMDKAEAEAKAEALRLEEEALSAGSDDATDDDSSDVSTGIATDPASLESYYDAILSDLLDDVPVETVKADHAFKIEAIRLTDAAMYERLMGEINAA